MRVPDHARWGLTHGLIRLLMRRDTRAHHENAWLSISDPEVLANPYPHYELLRSSFPFANEPAGLVTAHHSVASHVLRSDSFGAASFGGAPKPIRRILQWGATGAARSVVEPPSMLVVDPPAHSRYRRLVTGAFTARAVNRLRERTESIAADLLDGVATKATVDGTVDIVHDYAALLPVLVICDILGAPTSMAETFLRWGDAAVRPLDPGLSWRDFHNAQQQVDELLDWLAQHFQTLRREPGDGIFSQLVGARTEEGDTLTDAELLATSELVLAAGFETVVNLIGNGVVLLHEHPDQLHALQADRASWKRAVDEILRYDPPVQRTARRALRDTVVAGQPVREEQLVIVLLSAANRDPEVFTEPAIFDVRRSNADKHLSFSTGIHHCLGTELARMEGEVAFRKLYERFPQLELVRTPIRRQTTNLRGYTSVTVAPDPRTIRTSVARGMPVEPG